jgi:hypothetical protein
MSKTRTIELTEPLRIIAGVGVFRGYRSGRWTRFRLRKNATQAIAHGNKNY